MKTPINFRQYFPVLTLSIVFLASSIDVNAQNYRTEKKDKKSAKTEYRTDKSISVKSQKDNREGKYDNEGYISQKSNKVYRPQYSLIKKQVKPSFYKHPKYGKVYQRFDHNPIVFKFNNGRYFLFDDHFFTYKRGIGYCLVEVPRNIYFEQLPFDCNRIYVNGQLLFRNGNLFFKHSTRGYTLVPAPLDVRFTARF